MARNGRDKCESRRSFLSRSATMLAAGAVLPAMPGVAQSGETRWMPYGMHPQAVNRDLPERRSINSPYAISVAGDLRAAVSAMMALPPTDPRNWYRQAIIHVLDCPHANGWFLPWHRGYLYWFECIARKLTNNPTFALPYWDVTTYNRMSSLFFRKDLLDTSAPGYIHNREDFHRVFHDPLKEYWQSLSREQLQLLKLRGFECFDHLWVDLARLITNTTTRKLTATNTTLPPDVQDAVSMSSLVNSLAPQDFFVFGGSLEEHHSVMGDQSGPLESQLHNMVHFGVGGYMGDFLSSTDPVFWLHHANVDRIWDVWMERQKLTAQDGPAKWRNEPFLFFCDENGRSVKGIAGDYVSSAELGYRFEPGAPIETKPNRPANASWPVRSPCALASDTLPFGGNVKAMVSLGEAACDAFRNDYQSALVVEVDRPASSAPIRFHIQTKVVSSSNPYAFKHCGYATFFGSMSHSHGQGSHTGSLTICISKGLRECLMEAGPGAQNLEIAVNLQANGGVSPAPLKVRKVSLVSF